MRLRSFFNSALTVLAGLFPVWAEADQCEALSQRARALYAAGNRFSAAVLFEQMYETCSDSGTPAFYLGLASASADSAARFFEIALFSPDSSIQEEARFRLGQYHWVRKEYAKSKEYFRQVFDRQRSRSLDALGAWAGVCQDEGDWAQASVWYQKLRTTTEPRNPLYSLACKGLGDCAVRQKNYIEGLGYYKEALGQGDSATLLNRLAETCALAGEKDLESAYRSLLAASFPGNTPANLPGAGGVSEPKQAQPGPKVKPSYWIQLGVFGNPANAVQLQKDLSAKIQMADSLSIEIERARNLSIVRLGPFESEASAQDYGRQTLNPLNRKFLITLIR